MSIPWPENRPDQSVGNDSGAQLTQGFQVVARSIQGLERVIQTQTAMLERTQNASNRFLVSGGGQGQIRHDVLQGVAASGGVRGGAHATQVTGMGAMSSVEGLQAYGAQKLGQWIAGTPLYEQPGQGNGAGATPVGTPTSSGRAPGSGAGGSGGYSGGAPGGGTGGGGTPAGTPSSSGGGPSGSGGGGGGRGGGSTPAGTPSSSGGGGGGGGSKRGGLPGMIFGRGTRGGPGTQAGTAVLQQLGARVAMSGGGLSGIGNALKQVPGVGLVVDAVDKGADFYQSQREAGRVYQEVEGGTNLGAQTERLHALAYEASMFGRMPEGAAAQSFGAVTAMGYNQAANGEGQQMQNRQSALNFIYHNYTQTGMDQNQSLQLLQTASQDANVNLQQLSSTLSSLSKAAGQAGTNAETARNQFNSYFQAALGSGMSNGATAVAGGVSSMQASMGKEFSNVNFSGELSSQRQYLLSGMTGMPASQLQYTARNNPGAYNQLLAGQNMQFLTQGGLMTSQMQQGLNQMIQSVGGGNAIAANPTLRDQIANQFLNKYQVSDNIDTNLWAQEISAMTGVQMNPTQAIQWLVSQSAGVNEASHNSSVASSKGTSVKASDTKGAPTGKYGLAQAVAPVINSTSRERPDAEAGKSWQQVLQGSSAGSGAANAYLSQESKSGQRSPVLEALLQNASSSDQVMVQTSSGQRVMSMADAMKYYPNELASGNVEFYNKSGKAIGNTSSITQGLVNAGANVSGEEKQKAGSKVGVTASAWEKAHPSAKTAGGGQAVTISLSSEAQQLLKLLPSNNDQAAATSTVPYNPNPSQASR